MADAESFLREHLDGECLAALERLPAAGLERAVAGEVAEQDFPLVLELGPDEAQPEEETPESVFVGVPGGMPGGAAPHGRSPGPAHRHLRHCDWCG